MNTPDITFIIVLFLLFDIVFYLVVVKGMMMQSIIGKEDPARRSRDKNTPHFAIQLMYKPDTTYAAAGRGRLAENHANAPADSNALLQRELSKLTLEKIDFNPPYDLMVGIPGKLRATLQQDFSQQLKELINKANLPKVRTLSIGTTIETSLKGDGLRIKPIGDPLQNIHAPNTEWQWEVVPQKAGRRIFSLEIVVRIKIPSGEQKIAYSWPGGEVRIHANGYYATIQFLKKSWLLMLIAGSLIAPLVVLWFST